MYATKRPHGFITMSRLSSEAETRLMAITAEIRGK